MFYCKPFAHIFFNCSLIHLQNSVLLSIAFFILRTPDTLIVYLVFDILDILTAVFILRFYLFTSFWLLLGWASFRVTFFAIPFLLNYVSFWVAPSSFTLLLHCQWAFSFLLGLSEYLQHQSNYLTMALLVLISCIFLDYIQCVKSVRIQSCSGPYFAVFGLNTKRYSVSLLIQSEFGKMPTRIIPNTDTFT